MQTAGSIPWLLSQLGSVSCSADESLLPYQIQLPTSLPSLRLAILHSAATYPHHPQLTFTVFFFPLLMWQTWQRQLLALLWYLAVGSRVQGAQKGRDEEVDGRS